MTEMEARKIARAVYPGAVWMRCLMQKHYNHDIWYGKIVQYGVCEEVLSYGDSEPEAWNNPALKIQTHMLQRLAE